MGPKTIGGPNEHHDWVLMGGAWGKALLWMMIIKRKGNLGFPVLLSHGLQQQEGESQSSKTKAS